LLSVFSCINVGALHGSGERLQVLAPRLPSPNGSREPEKKREIAMTQATFYCHCGADPRVRAIRVSLVNLNPPYGSARVRGSPDAEWTTLERIAKPTDVATSAPRIEVELLDQTRSCTLACIGWTGWDGKPRSCEEIREMTLKQGDTRFRPVPPKPRRP
jgi:hypothetical protein